VCVYEAVVWTAFFSCPSDAPELDRSTQPVCGGMLSRQLATQRPPRIHQHLCHP
jgi:hypothetical protein